MLERCGDQPRALQGRRQAPGQPGSRFVGAAAAQACKARTLVGNSAAAQGARLNDAALGVAAAQRIVQRQRATRDGFSASTTYLKPAQRRCHTV